MMQRDVIAEQGIRAETDVVDSHKIYAVLKVLHEGFDVMARVSFSDRGMGGRFDADHSTLLSTGGQHAVRLHT